MRNSMFASLLALAVLALAAAPALAQEVDAAAPTDELSGAEDVDAETEGADAPAHTERTYRYISSSEWRRLDAMIDFDQAVMSGCTEAAESGPRERAVTNITRYRFFVWEDGYEILYTGDDDLDGEIQTCLEEELEELELDDPPAEFAGSAFNWTVYEDTYYTQRRKRHAEIIALYTLSGVSLATGVGSLVAANREANDADEQPGSAIGMQNREDREDRFRRAGWSLIGISIASAIGGDILFFRNRAIERDENPMLGVAPVSPTGGLGLTLSSRF